MTTTNPLAIAELIRNQAMQLESSINEARKQGLRVDIKVRDGWLIHGKDQTLIEIETHVYQELGYFHKDTPSA